MAKAQWKLVRDNIPNIIQASNTECETRILDDAAYTTALNKKLLEETKELIDALQHKSKEDQIEELSDVLEVIAAIQLFHQFDVATLFDVAETKRVEKGSFLKRIQLKL